MDWTAIGTIIAAVALAGSGIGALARRRRARRAEQRAERQREEAERRAQEPRIVFGDLYLAGPGEHPRAAYGYAIGMRATNAGSGPALYPTWGFEDAEEDLFAEVVGRESLGPHQSTDDWSGVRGRRQEDDPDGASVRAFYERCVAYAVCWDSRGDAYLFRPFGGGRAPHLKGGPQRLREFLAGRPSRRELRRALGTEPSAEEDGP